MVIGNRVIAKKLATDCSRSATGCRVVPCAPARLYRRAAPGSIPFCDVLELRFCNPIFAPINSPIRDGWLIYSK
jgi:hypothetical protein